MIKPPLLNDDEWQALRGLRDTEVSARMRQAWHWYNTRIVLITVVVFTYVALLLGWADALAMRFDVSADLQALYRDYFLLRGWMLAGMGLVGVWSWWHDWRVVRVQGVLLVIALVTIATDVVLIYGQVPLVPGTGFAMSLVARLLSIICLALNVWHAGALPPLAERKFLWWHVTHRRVH